MAPGAVLAVLAHAGLLAALAAGVNWRTHAPEVVAAELWASVPQVAAPRPVSPPPPPPPAPVPAPAPAPQPAPVPQPAPAPPPAAAQLPDPQIAIEQERRREALAAEQAARDEAARRKKAEALAQAQADARARQAREREARLKAEAEAAAKEKEKERARLAQAARERAADDARLAKQRKENLERMLGQAGAATGTGAPTSRGTAAQDAAPSASYGGRLVASIKPNIVFTDRLRNNPAAEVEVRTAPNGSVLARRLLKSSGNPDWDEAVLRAIDRTGTLPRDTDGRVPPVITITFRPND
jgi:colicin import membrane protein